MREIAERTPPVFRPPQQPYVNDDLEPSDEPDLWHLWEIGDYRNLDAYMKHVAALPPNADPADNDEIRRARQLLDTIRLSTATAERRRQRPTK